MSMRLRLRMAVAVTVVVIPLVASVAPASAGKPPPPPVTVTLVCPSTDYAKVDDVALFDAKGNRLYDIGAMECGAGNLSTYPGTGAPSTSGPLALSKLPAQVGYAGSWRCANTNFLGGEVVTNGAGYALTSLNRKPPTTITCAANAFYTTPRYASYLQVSW